jgi:predicted Ser/Thr protein kinase
MEIDWNTVSAVATVVAAIGSFVAASIAVFTASSARKQAESTRKVVTEQTKALLEAARANALATRLRYYDEQRSRAMRTVQGSNLKQLTDEQEHLVYQLDEVLNRLGVGISRESANSPHNELVKRLRADRQPADAEAASGTRG